MQIPFGGEQPLHQRCGTTPQDRMTGQDQFMSHCGQGVTFPDAWFPHGDHIDGCLQKGSALEPFQLEFQGWAKMPRLKGQKGLSCRQARLAQQPCGPSCYALLSRAWPAQTDTLHARGSLSPPSRPDPYRWLPCHPNSTPPAGSAIRSPDSSDYAWTLREGRN